jgi:tetratricopeptide (TPR) repeat protein
MPHTKTHWDDELFPPLPGAPAHDDLAVALRALETGDLPHAAHHVASALGEDPNDAKALALFDRILDGAPDPLALFVLEGGDEPPSYALVAGRAYVHARLGKLTAALDAIFRVEEVRPELDYFAWAARWLEKPGAAASVAPNGVDEGIRRFVLRFRGTVVEDAQERGWLARGEPIVRALAEAHPKEGYLLTWYAALLRKTGELERAIATATAAYAADPSTATAVALGMAHRARGEMDEAIAAFQKGAAHDPKNPYVHLDIGDIRLDREDWAGALAAYEAALAIKPEEGWAEPSAMYCRYRIDGDAKHVKALEKLAKGHHGNDRARALLDRIGPRKAATQAKPPAKKKAAKRQ